MVEEHRHRRALAVLSADGGSPSDSNWSVVPENRAGPTPLPTEAIEGFVSHFRRVASEVRRESERRPYSPPRSVESPPGDPEVSSPAGPGRPSPAPSAIESEALARGCAACRGWCCRRGGTHAFLDAASLRRVLRTEEVAGEGGRRLDLSDLEARYLSHLGDDHLEGGCLFQGPSGCRLPRDLRSDTCNEWLCEDLTGALGRWRESDGPPSNHRFVAVARATEAS